PLVVLPFALLLVVAGVSTPNPTAAGQEMVLDRADAARGILRVTRSPVLWGIGLWALAHLVPNGDLGSLMFFGSLAILALLGTLTIEARQATSGGEAWQRFCVAASNLPMAAIAAGRQRLAPGEIGWARLAVAAALYLALLALHPWLFGASALPRG